MKMQVFPYRHADGEAGPDKGTVDLPGAEAGAQTPDVLWGRTVILRVPVLWCGTLNARQAKLMAEQKARQGAKRVVRVR